MPFLGTMTLGDMLSAQPRASSAMSGKALISTLAAHASRTWKDDDSVDSTAGPTSDSPPDASTFQRGLSSQLATEVARMSTTELAIWIVSELADGLAHAHQRGVLHRDIKPANVLLSDDGLPMLLDFNLAASTRPDDRSHQVVGGTLRYMSPEQLRAVQNQRSTLDARADVFSLGVVLYELLMRRAPFVDRTGSWNEVLQQMLHDRQMLPTIDLDWREGITPAVQSILQRALAFDPDLRYQSASEFRDDLRAHLQARPLPTAKVRSVREWVRKWNTRHPRLSSMTLAAAFSAILLGGTLVWTISRQAQLNQLRASQWVSELEHVQSTARTLLASDYAPTSAIANWMQQSASVLTSDATQLIARLPGTEQTRARQCLGRLHFYRARGAIGMLDREAADQRKQWLDTALTELEQAQSFEPTQLGRAWQDSLQRLAASDQSIGNTPGSDGAAAPDPKPFSSSKLEVDAETLTRELNSAYSQVHAEASNPWHWVSIGQMQLKLGRLEPAAATFQLSHNLADREPLPAFFLGLVDMKLKRFAQADEWFSFTLAQDSQCWEAWMNRAATRVELGRYAEAIADIDAMQKQIERYPRAWFIREMAETRLGKHADAQRSRLQGLQLPPTDASGWNARGQARLRHKPIDANAALADFEMAIRLDPQLRSAYENAAHVLAEHLGQPQAAIERLSDVLKLDPEYALAWSSRAVLAARQGNFESAASDIEQALRLDRSPMICYQCASALALAENEEPADDAGASDAPRTASHTRALQLLKETLRKDASLSRFMRKDNDLRSLLKNSEFHELMQAAVRLQ